MKAPARRLSLLATLWLALALRLFRLDHQELRGDEAFGYFFSLRPLVDIVQATVELAEPHPVAGYFAQHGWLEQAGHSEFALRFLSATFGVLAVALIYRMGRRLCLSPAVSLLAAILLAVSPYAIWHSQDARMYSMSLALTSASTLLALEWLHRRRFVLGVVYVAVSWLALQTHYFAVFILLAQYFFVVGRAVLKREARSALLPWLAMQGAVALCYLPWLYLASDTLLGYGGNGDSPTLSAMAYRAFSVFAVGESVAPSQRPAFALVGGLLVTLGFYRLYRAARVEEATLLLLYLGTPLLATWLAATQRPIFDERYLVAAVPPFFLLVASVLQRPAPGSYPKRAYPALRYTALLLVAVLAAGMVISLGGHYGDPGYGKSRGWRQLATVLDRLSDGYGPNRALIAQNFPDPTLWYYYQGDMEHVVLPPAPHDRAGAARSVARLVDAGVERVVLPLQPAPNWDESGIAADTLGRQYDLTAEMSVGVWPVRVYDRAPANLRPIDVGFADGLSLAAGHVPASALPGGVLTVFLAWSGDAGLLAGSEKVFVHLLDGGGQVVAQRDLPLTTETVTAPTGTPSSYGILIPETLPPGQYRLVAGLYDPGREGAPRLLTEDGQDHLFLGEVNLVPAGSR